MLCGVLMGLYQNLILFLFVKVRRMYHYAASEEEIARTLHLLCWTWLFS